jgi:drug/metabolite transporter (DMT)-like permease
LVRRTGYRVHRVSWAHVAVMAVLANIAPYLLYGWAQQYVASSLAGALNATTPLLTCSL